MKNSIEARIEFSYQGVNYTPSAIIDLDEMMLNARKLANFHAILARLNGIDTYSYLYEVMESHPIQFSNPSGLARQFVREEGFDIHAFEALWHEEQELPVLSDIAQNYLKIGNLDEHEDIKQALLAAYRAGKGL